MPSTPDLVPEPQPESLSMDDAARRRGRLGLAIPWENIPWWGIIIIIVGVIVAFSVFTNTQYIDVIRFVFDLPWNKETVVKEDVEDGEWSLTPKSPLNPGTYTFYVDFLDESDDVVARSDVYRVTVPRGAEEIDADPITTPGETAIVVDTSTPTFAGASSVGVEVVLVDDFSKSPLRIARRIWNADGVFLTIRVTLMAFAFALVLGLLMGLMRVTSGSPNLMEGAGWRLLIGIAFIILVLIFLPRSRSLTGIISTIVGVEIFMFLLPAMPYTLSTLYVEVIRGIPMLVIVLYMGFAVTPALRNASENWITGEIDLRGLPAAIIGLSFGYGAYLAEIYRAGIESIHKGQMEAARSLGMSYFQAMRHVILPQAIRVVLPPLGNDFIAMLKDSSLISVVALPEMLQQGRLWISRNFRAFEGFNSVALLYLVMTLILSMLVSIIERRTAIE